MPSEQDLINKLMISKKIMERHESMGRSSSGQINTISTPVVEDYQPVSGNYNIPQEYLAEAQTTKPTSYESSIPTADRIANSKLPDEIKRLMMEHPIQQPSNPLTGGGPTLSNDLIEKASRLMNTKANGDIIDENVVKRQPQQIQNQPSINSNEIRDIVRETVEQVLKENGLLVESTKKSNEQFKFRVGQHLFEGRVTKIRKISE
jgi:hypothetical protein